MPWTIWEDTNDDRRPVYALWTRRAGCPDAKANPAEAAQRMWKLGSAGRVYDVTAAMLPHVMPAGAIDQLAMLGEPAGLAYSGGLTPVLQHDGRIYTLTEGKLWALDLDGHTWEVCTDWPPDLVKLKGGVLGVLEE